MSERKVLSDYRCHTYFNHHLDALRQVLIHALSWRWGSGRIREVKKIPSTCALSSSPYAGINAAIEQVSVMKDWENPEQLQTAVMTDRPRERPSTCANMWFCVMSFKRLGHEKLSPSHGFAESHGQVSLWLSSAGAFLQGVRYFLFLLCSLPSKLEPCMARYSPALPTVFVVKLGIRV